VLCNKFAGCNGFTFPSGLGLGSKKKGSGCLKRCGRKEYGGLGKGKHDYWQKVDKSMPKRYTPGQEKRKKILKKVIKKVVVNPKVVKAKNPKKEAKKLVDKVVPKAIKETGASKKTIKKDVKKAEKQVNKLVAPAGKRGLVANQQQTQTKNGKKRIRKRSGAGKWAKHGCKVTANWANAHITWCPWGSWGKWDGKKPKLTVTARHAHGEQLLGSTSDGTGEYDEESSEDGDY
jgi:ribosomal protein L17